MMHSDRIPKKAPLVEEIVDGLLDLMADPQNRLLPRRFRPEPRLHQYEVLADGVWTQHAYGRNAVYPNGHHGNAVLSKFPIVHHENRDVSVGKHEQRGLHRESEAAT